MTATALTLAAVLALAGDPACGGDVVSALGSEGAVRVAAIAQHESGLDPFVIGVNVGPRRGAHRFPDAASAAAFAATLDEERVDYDAGLMQINRRNFGRHGLTLSTAFDACRNLAAGIVHIAEDVRAVWQLAHRRYNCGNTNCGDGYLAAVERAVASTRARLSLPPSPAPSSSSSVTAPPVRQASPAVQSRPRPFNPYTADTTVAWKLED